MSTPGWGGRKERRRPWSQWDQPRCCNPRRHQEGQGFPDHRGRYRDQATWISIARGKKNMAWDLWGKQVLNSILVVLVPGSHHQASGRGVSWHRQPFIDFVSLRPIYRDSHRFYRRAEFVIRESWNWKSDMSFFALYLLRTKIMRQFIVCMLEKLNVTLLCQAW